MRPYTITFSIVLLLSTVGCGDSDTTTKLFNEDVAPVTSGSWYQPSLTTSWQWQLAGTINTSYLVDMYDVDLFDTPQNTIDTLHADGKKVICYFSGGSYENYRSDAIDFAPEVLGNTLDGWPDEKWLDISNEKIAPLMLARLDLAKEKGCDGVEPDNMDGYTNNTGFTLTASDQLAYNKFIANEAHKRGLSVGLKNDLNQIVALEPYFDFSVNEQCHEYSECNTLVPFINASKPVFNAEYLQAYQQNNAGARDTMCADTIALHFKTLILALNLDDSLHFACD